MAFPNWKTIIATLNSRTLGDEYEEVNEKFQKGDMNEKIQVLYTLVEKKQVVPEYEKRPRKNPQISSELRERGNKAYINNQDTDALELYTESVSYAPTNSEELALAYANRSVVLFRLKKFTSALVDINRALKSGYPQVLVPKLVTRKQKCISRINTLDAEREYAVGTIFLDVLIV